MGNLTGASAARQKELEQLKKAEAEATAAKKREQTEIAKREAELSALDRQIADMKGRLGSGTARSSDSLDQIIAMAEQKEEQGKRLEDLRRQRETEERKRQEEIEQLKREAKAKKAAQVQADLAKYEKVASSKYAQDMKGAAWGAMVANYPEAKDVTEGDVDQFVAQLGFVHDGSVILSKEDKERREEEKRRIAYQLEQKKIAEKNVNFNKYISGTWKTPSGSLNRCSDGQCVSISQSEKARNSGYYDGEVIQKEFSYLGDGRFSCYSNTKSNKTTEWVKAEMKISKSSMEINFTERNSKGEKLQGVRNTLVER